MWSTSLLISCLSLIRFLVAVQCHSLSSQHDLLKKEFNATEEIQNLKNQSNSSQDHGANLQINKSTNFDPKHEDRGHKIGKSPNYSGSTTEATMRTFIQPHETTSSHSSELNPHTTAQREFYRDRTLYSGINKDGNDCFNWDCLHIMIPNIDPMPPCPSFCGPCGPCCGPCTNSIRRRKMKIRRNLRNKRNLGAEDGMNKQFRKKNNLKKYLSINSKQ